MCILPQSELVYKLVSLTYHIRECIRHTCEETLGRQELIDPIQPCKFESLNKFKDFYPLGNGSREFIRTDTTDSLLKKKELTKAEKVSKTSESSEKTIFCQVKCKLIKNTWIISLKIHTALKMREGKEIGKVCFGFGGLQHVWK